MLPPGSYIPIWATSSRKEIQIVEPKTIVTMARAVHQRWARVLDIAGRYRGVLAFVLVFLLGAFFTPKLPGTGVSVFLTWSTQRDTLLYYAEYGILAAGMTLVILAAGIDLSVGAVLGFSATLFSLLLMGYGWPALPAALVTILAASAMGALSGFVIARFRMQPFVATLGMMLVARGAAKWICAGQKVQPGAQTWYAMQTGKPAVFDWMTTPMRPFGLQPVILLFLVTILALWIVVKYTRFGRHIYAIGGNEEATRLSWVNVGMVKIGAYALCGMTAGLAGLCNASLNTLGDPEAGFTYELDAIAAVVIGGSSLAGGKGGMFFTLLGALIIAYINKILSLNNFEEPAKLMIRGSLIIVAVLIQQTLERVENRRVK